MPPAPNHVCYLQITMSGPAQMTRDLLEHVSMQLNPDSMDPFIAASAIPTRWPTSDHWRAFALLDDRARMQILRQAFAESTFSVYLQQMVNATQTNGMTSTAFYFDQDDLFDMLLVNNRRDETSNKVGTRNRSKRKLDKEREKDKLLLIYKTKNYAWPQTESQPTWLLGHILFPARAGVDSSDFTCSSILCSNAAELQQAIELLARVECRELEIKRTAAVNSCDIEPSNDR